MKIVCLLMICVGGCELENVAQTLGPKEQLVRAACLTPPWHEVRIVCLINLFNVSLSSIACILHLLTYQLVHWLPSGSCLVLQLSLDAFCVLFRFVCIVPFLDPYSHKELFPICVRGVGLQ